MARVKPFPIPPDDIPAWFMTYSDVITLLMTFFILLLTFASTQPERFEKSVSSTFASGSATGTTGKVMEDIDKDSFINRVRPPASRIAMRGAEMPPISRDPAKGAFGAGLRSLNDEERQQNEMTSHSFDVPIVEIFDSQGELTANGRLVCQMLAYQLRELPFQASIEFTNKTIAPNLAGMMEYLFDFEKTRPGQLSMTMIKNDNLDADHLRIVIKRFTGNLK